MQHRSRSARRQPARASSVVSGGGATRREIEQRGAAQLTESQTRSDMRGREFERPIRLLSLIVIDTDDKGLVVELQRLLTVAGNLTHQHPALRLQLRGKLGELF